MQAEVINDEEMLTSAQVCQLVGITYRQLDYWVRTGAVESPDNGQPDLQAGRYIKRPRTSWPSAR